MTFATRKYRSLFLSDFHLGSHNCEADRLLKFLRQHEAKRIYLIGDIIDIDTIFYPLPSSHRLIIEELVNKLLKKTEIIYVPGNHDRLVRSYVGKYGNLTVANSARHTTVDGHTILIAHGDELDFFKSNSLMNFISRLERALRGNFWELLRRILNRLVIRHTIRFESEMVKLAVSQGCNGVVCGHIHFPKITKTPILYLNCGDWTRHCSAIAEHMDGRFELIRE